MKKLKIFTFICIIAIVLCSCGNMSIGPGKYTFNKVHIMDDGKSVCVDIDKWHDNEGSGIEVHSEKYGSMFLSEGSYILIEDKCPICE